MNNLLDWTWKRVEETLINYKLEMEPWPSEFQNKQLGSSLKPLYIKGGGHIDEQRKFNVKNTVIYGHNIGIATLIIYPISDFQNLPIFAVEWVVIADKIHLLVADVCFIDEPKRKVGTNFSALYEKYKIQFPINREIPEWYQSIMGPHAIFGSSSTSLIRELEKMFSDYLKEYESLLADRYESLSSNKECKETLSYKNHHYENSPAKKILKTDLEWVDKYLKDYHFGPALI